MSKWSYRFYLGLMWAGLFGVLMFTFASVANAENRRLFGDSQKQWQDQEQRQSQEQWQEQTAHGGAGGQANSNSSADSVNRNRSRSDSTARSLNEGNNTSVNYRNDYSNTYSKYVAPAYGPPLVATSDCLGSVSSGGSDRSWGFALGFTFDNDECNAREDAKLLWSMGRHEAAIMRLCANPDNAAVLPECTPPVAYDLNANDTEVIWD